MNDRTSLQLDFDECFVGEPSSEGDPAADLHRGRRLRCRQRGTAVVVGAVAVVSAGLLGTAAIQHTQLSAEPAATPSAAPVSHDRDFLLPPDADQRIIYDGRIVSDPPPRRYPAPAVSADQVMAKVSDQQRSSGPTIVLRLLSGSGLDVPPATAEFYWVVYWSDTPAPHGGPLGSTPPPWMNNAICATYTFVNASTGKWARGIEQQCGAR